MASRASRSKGKAKQSQQPEERPEESHDELTTGEGQDSPHESDEDLADPEEEQSLRDQAQQQMPPPQATRVEIIKPRKPSATEATSQTLDNEKNSTPDTPASITDREHEMEVLRLRLQIAEAETKTAKLPLAKHERSTSDIVSETHDTKRRRTVKRPTKEEIYFSTDYANYRRFCHTVEASTAGWGAIEKFDEAYRFLDFTVADRWAPYLREHAVEKTWEVLKEFLEYLLGDKENRTHDAWMQWLAIRKTANESEDDYLRKWNELYVQIGEPANEASRIQLMLFFIGLDEPMKKKIREHAIFPETREDMVALAKKLRPNTHREYTAKSSSTSRGQSQGKASSSSTYADKKESSSSNPDYTNFQCRYPPCGKMGHIEKNCHLKAKHEAQNRSGPSTGVNSIKTGSKSSVKKKADDSKKSRF